MIYRIFRIFLQITFPIAMTMLLIASIPACSPEPVPPVNADEIAENVLVALVEGDFIKYTSFFAEELRGDLDEQKFNSDSAQIDIDYGEYIANSITQWKTEKEDSFNVVYYKTTFTKDPEDIEVIWKAVFKDFEGIEKLAGFELVKDLL